MKVFTPFCRVALLVLLGVMSIDPNYGWAQFGSDQRSAILQAADRAKASLNPALMQNPGQAAQAFLREADATSHYVRTRTSPANADAWLKYLGLDELRQAIQSNAPVAEQGRAAVALRERLIGFSPGLELPPLVRLRDSVSKLIAALRFADPEKSMEQLSAQLDALAKEASEIDAIPSNEDMATIAAILSSLDEAGQARGPVQTVRHLFNQPNAVVTVHEGFVQQAISRPVLQTRSIQDCILGTRLVGSASINGSVNADLRPSIGAARLSIQMNGAFSSSNRGYNRSVQLQTVGYGQVYASREVLINEQGVSLQPVAVQATLGTEIQSIEHRLRIVRRIAQKKAAQQKPQADAIALGKLQSRVAEQFSSETNQAQTIKPPDPMAKLRPWLGRLDLTEPTRMWGSTDTSLFIQSKLARPDQLASPIAAPPATGSFKIAVQVHESLVDNVFSPVLAGRTINQSQIDKILQDVRGRATVMSTRSSGVSLVSTKALQTDDSDEPFEIDFSRFRPVIFEARDNQLTIGIRGTRFAKGSRELSRAMEITAKYVPALDSSGHALLLRTGDIDVSFPGRGRLTISQTAIRTTIEKSFADVFPAVIGDQPIRVPPTVQMDALRGQTLYPSQIAMQNGWFSIGVQ